MRNIIKQSMYILMGRRRKAIIVAVFVAVFAVVCSLTNLLQPAAAASVEVIDAKSALSSGKGMPVCVPAESRIQTHAALGRADIAGITQNNTAFAGRSSGGRVLALPLAVPQQALTGSAVVTLNGNTLTVVCGEGAKLKASDFIIGGEDLSVYTWTKQSDNSSINLNSLIGTSEQLTLVKDGSLIDSGIVPHNNIKVNFYVFVDGEKVGLGTQYVTSYSFSNAPENNRHYISAGLLESVYNDYGFTAGMLDDDTRYFPHVNENKDPIWADTDVLRIGNNTFSPITLNGSAVDVYYLPKQTLGKTSGKYGEHIAANSFYTVTIDDTDNKVYDEERIELWLSGETVTVTVSNIDDYVWSCVGENSGTMIEGVPSADNTESFTIPAINEPYFVSTSPLGNKRISYIMALPEPPYDTEYGTPTIGGSTNYSLTVPADAVYTLIAPSMSTYRFKHDKYLGEATFKGWEIVGANEPVCNSGDNITLSNYTMSNIRLRAVWDIKAGGTWQPESKNGSVVNYFVSLAAFPEGSTEIKGSAQEKEFTDSVHVTDCHVAGTDVRNQRLYKGDPETMTDSGGVTKSYYVLGGTDVSKIYDEHEALTGALTQGYHKQGLDGEDYVFYADFPSDEEVLREVRKMIRSGNTHIYIYDHELTAEEVTAAAFTVKWYVFKWMESDGWHIDGYLIARKGVMNIQKRFGGDAEAKNAIINAEGDDKYSISIEKKNSEDPDPIYGLGTLNLSNATYNPEKDVYEWSVETDLYYDYVVKENNYIYSGESTDDYTTLPWYRIIDPITSEQTVGWTKYNPDEGVPMKGRDPRVDDEVLTLMLENVYVPAGEIVLQKIGAESNMAMPNVSFTLGSDETNFVIYDLGNSHYTFDSTSGGTPTSTVTTDVHGRAFLKLELGSYTLSENELMGYRSPGTISFNIVGTDAMHGFIEEAHAQNDDAGIQFVQVREERTLEIKNYSRYVPLTVKKTWVNDENTPVTLQLFRNGVSMGRDYEVILDGVTDEKETAPWECTFPNVPLTFENSKAEYSVREEAINGFFYSDVYESGFNYYAVSYDKMAYYDGNNQLLDSNAVGDAQSIVLGVSNRRISHELSLLKQDENETPVDKAWFRLFLIPALETDTNVVWSNGVLSVDGEPRTTAAESYSDGSGTINFGNMTPGMYYLIESAAPEGYRSNNTVYRVELTELGRIELNQLVKTHNGDSWELIENNTIVNRHITKNITVKKTDNNDDFLEGAVFKLQKEIEANVYEDYQNEFAIDTEQGVTVENLECGNYLLCEVTAPNGYYKLPQPIEFSVSEYGAEYNGTSGSVFFNEQTSTFTVINRPGSLLPQTGGSGAYYSVSFGIISMLAGIALYQHIQRKNRLQHILSDYMTVY